MAAPSSGPSDVIAQLNTARTLALRSGSDYVQLVSGVLPVISPTADISLRRWGADLLCETFSSSHILAADKDRLAPSVLPVIRGLLDPSAGDLDHSVYKHAIQTASSLYPLIFRHCANNAQDCSSIWQSMVDIKTRICQLLESGPIGIRMCCIKFFQSVVLAQTPTQVDPRMQHLQTDVSLSIVPRSHPVLNAQALQQESRLMLDRILNVLLDISTDPVLLTAVMNCLGALVRARSSLITVTVETALSFRPFAGVQKSLSSSSHVIIRSIERTTRLLFKTILVKYPAHPLVPKIKDYLVRLERSHIELLDQASRKRSAPSDQDSDAIHMKRARLESSTPPDQPKTYPTLPDGPISLAQLVTLTTDAHVAAFDVKALSADVVATLLVPLLQSIDERLIDQTIHEVKTRCHIRNLQAEEKAAAAAAAAATAAAAAMNPDIPADDEVEEGEEEEDFYEPTLPTENAVPGLSNGDANDDGDDLYDPSAAVADRDTASISPALRQSALPQPQVLPPDVAAAIGSSAVDKILARIAAMSSKNPDWKPGNGQLGGFGTLPTSGNDRKSWVIFLARLATRADHGLDPDDFIDPEDDTDDSFPFDSLSKLDVNADLIASKIRNGLLQYTLQDFRQHIDLAVTWLTEEWLNDMLRLEEHQKKVESLELDTDTEQNPSQSSSTGASKHQKRKWRRQRKQRMLKLQMKQREMVPPPQLNYKSWTIKLIDAILPFLEGRDRVLIRLLSELPMLDPDILARVRKLAEDPERVGLCTQALQYLIMLRTPVRDMCLDIVEELWKDYEDARPSAKKILARWRPNSLKEKGRGGGPPGGGGGGGGGGSHRGGGSRQPPVLVDRSEATTPGDGLPWD